MRTVCRSSPQPQQFAVKSLFQRRFNSGTPTSDDAVLLSSALEIGQQLHKGLGIYHSRLDALTVLEEVRRVRPCWFNESCEMFVDEVRNVADLLPTSSSSLLHPLVVVEGLDGVGKTTVTTNLCKNIGGVLFRTPSPRFEASGSSGEESVRERFRRQPETISRAFYCGANYLAAVEVQAARMNGPVLMDRWWGSTCSMALAGRAARLATTTTNVSDLLPPANSEVYQWPADLPEFTLGVVLEVEESIRRKRAQLRGDEKEEERQLAEREDMRRAAMTAYARMEGRYTLVDVPKWPLAVNRIIDLLEDKHIFPAGQLKRHSQAEIDAIRAF